MDNNYDGSRHLDRSRRSAANYHSSGRCCPNGSRRPMDSHSHVDSYCLACNHHRGCSRLSSPDRLPGSGLGSVACRFLCRLVGRLSVLGPVVVRSVELTQCSY